MVCVEIVELDVVGVVLTELLVRVPFVVVVVGAAITDPTVVAGIRLVVNLVVVSLSFVVEVVAEVSDVVGVIVQI